MGLVYGLLRLFASLFILLFNLAEDAASQEAASKWADNLKG